jgi:nucleoside-diphosphate-sugar epimerase
MASPIIVTGAAGFIGLHVVERLLARGETVIGVDVFNAYYDPALKNARAAATWPATFRCWRRAATPGSGTWSMPARPASMATGR